MLYTQILRYATIPTKILPSVNKNRKVSIQLLYFCNAMRLSRYAGWCLLLFMFANISQAVAQDTWSLQRCVDYALQHNIQVRQQDIQKRMAELTLKQSKLNRIPSVNASLGGAYNEGRNPSPETNTYIQQSFTSLNGSANVQGDIFNWFAKQNLVKANTFDLHANNFLLDKARNDLAFNVATAFLQILLNIEQVKVNEVQVKLTNSNLANTKKLVIAGSVPESNQADLEAQLATDSVNLVTAQNNVITSILQMKAYMNLDFEIPFQPEVPENIFDLPMAHLSEMAPEMVYSAATTTYPLLKADDYKVQAAEYNYRSTRAGLYPSLGFNAGLGSSFANNFRSLDLTKVQRTIDTVGYLANAPAQFVVKEGAHIPSNAYFMTPFGDQISNNFQQFIQLNLRIPIFNGWQVRANTKKAQLNVENAKLTKEQDVQKLRQDIYTAHANAVAALQKYTASSKGVDAAQKAYDFATKRFNLGLMNTIDYITTQSKLFRAQIDKVSAQYDYIFKMKLLEFYRDQKISL
ncbi:outer membrane protein [Chitinophaga jiangningensis]|uniref:Outer membrane protein n=2 Tax=Chitinophaga jiangningensis TaxID=1419482 RepID=A0A1M7HSZ6_9BACT|nr:outer membrane protein [Chitinophaga jiangningensis]